jgi:LPXTG-motif cell wall-anchored protein
LPFTGSDTGALALFAVVCMVVGLVLAARKRR